MKTYVLEITFTDGTKGQEIWTPERTKRAFNFRKGTEKDLINYIENNKGTIKLLYTY